METDTLCGRPIVSEKEMLPCIVEQWAYCILRLKKGTALPDGLLDSFRQHSGQWRPAKTAGYNPLRWKTFERAVFCKGEGPTFDELVAAIPTHYAFTAAVVRFRKCSVSMVDLRPEDRNIMHGVFYCYSPMPVWDAKGFAYFGLSLGDLAMRFVCMAKVAQRTSYGSDAFFVHDRLPSHFVEDELFPHKYLQTSTMLVLRAADNALLTPVNDELVGRFIGKYLTVAVLREDMPYFHSWTDQVMAQLPAHLFHRAVNRYIVANQYAADRVGDTFLTYTWIWESL